MGRGIKPWPPVWKTTQNGQWKVYFGSNLTLLYYVFEKSVINAPDSYKGQNILRIIFDTA